MFPHRLSNHVRCAHCVLSIHPMAQHAPSAGQKSQHVPSKHTCRGSSDRGFSATPPAASMTYGQRATTSPRKRRISEKSVWTGSQPSTTWFVYRVLFDNCHDSVRPPRRWPHAFLGLVSRKPVQNQ